MNSEQSPLNPQGPMSRRSSPGSVAAEAESKDSDGRREPGSVAVEGGVSGDNAETKSKPAPEAVEQEKRLFLAQKKPDEASSSASDDSSSQENDSQVSSVSSELSKGSETQSRKQPLLKRGHQVKKSWHKKLEKLTQDRKKGELLMVEESPNKLYVRFNELLGSGSFKKVYLGYDTRRGMEVAWNSVQMTNANIKGNAKLRLRKELKILQTLNHKSIMKFYCSWFDQETKVLTFITEVMSSGTLQEFVQNRPVMLRIVKRWARHILKALVYLHEEHTPSIIHRDLKCSNIFISGNSGQIRIGDLGLASWERTGNAKSVLGTPEYMAREMFDESYDEKVDIYAFGLCVCEIVTKEVPYSECSNAAQIYKKLLGNELPRSFHRLKEGTEIKAFVSRCIAHKAQRPSASALLEEKFFDRESDEVENTNTAELLVDGGDPEKFDSEYRKHISSNSLEAEAPMKGYDSSQMREALTIDAEDLKETLGKTAQDQPVSNANVVKKILNTDSASPEIDDSATLKLENRKLLKTFLPLGIKIKVLKKDKWTDAEISGYSFEKGQLQSLDNIDDENITFDVSFDDGDYDEFKPGFIKIQETGQILSDFVRSKVLGLKVAGEDVQMHSATSSSSKTEEKVKKSVKLPPLPKAEETIIEQTPRTWVISFEEREEKVLICILALKSSDLDAKLEFVVDTSEQSFKFDNDLVTHFELSDREVHDLEEIVNEQKQSFLESSHSEKKFKFKSFKQYGDKKVVQEPIVAAVAAPVAVKVEDSVPTVQEERSSSISMDEKPVDGEVEKESVEMSSPKASSLDDNASVQETVSRGAQAKVTASQLRASMENMQEMARKLNLQVNSLHQEFLDSKMRREECQSPAFRGLTSQLQLLKSSLRMLNQTMHSLDESADTESEEERTSRRNSSVQVVREEPMIRRSNTVDFEFKQRPGAEDETMVCKNTFAANKTLEKNYKISEDMDLFSQLDAFENTNLQKKKATEQRENVDL